MTNEVSNRTHYPALDGLRGLAILLVVVYHNFQFIPPFDFGWLGVDLFFVLSGFLITDILLTTRNTRNYFKNFYARRILRIFPLYYLTLLLFLVIFPLIKEFPVNLSYYKHYQWWFWTYLQNWPLIFTYDGKSPVLVHYWSLAVEEQYYLVWPFFVVFIKNPKNLLLCCVIGLLIVISSRIYIWNTVEFNPYALFLFTRIDGILIGSMLAIVYHINQDLLRKYSTILTLGLAMLNFTVYFLHQTLNFPVWPMAGYASFSALFALLVYESIKRENKVINAVFTNSILRFFGKYSYGFYIFHWPVYVIFYPYVETMVRDNMGFTGFNLQVAVSLIVTIMGFAVSLISYHVYEKYWLKLKVHFT